MQKKSIKKWHLTLGILAGMAAKISFADNTLTEFYRDVRTFQGQFEQTQINEKGKVLSTSQGDFWVARPDKFRWDYRKPFNQQIISDGRKLWLFEADLAQVTVQNASEAIKATPSALLTGGVDLQAQFNISQMKSTDSSVTWWRLTPKAQSSEFSEARIALKQNLPITVEIKDLNNQTTRLRLYKTSSNYALGDVFNFRAPNYVEVVDQTRR